MPLYAILKGDMVFFIPNIKTSQLSGKCGDRFPDPSVEMSVMMNILAAGLEISEEELRSLRGRCIQQVRKARGKISIEEAVKFQQGIGE